MWKLVLEKATLLSGILMESIFLPSSSGTLWKCRGEKVTAKITVFFFNITKWHWKDQNARFQGNNWTLRYHYLFIRQFLG